MAVAAAALLGCGTAGPVVPATAATGQTAPGAIEPAPAGAGDRAHRETGKASYYSHAFDGRRTASGERYNPEAMTAAHKWMPLGTWIRVTRVGAGNQSVVVRVNDRCGCHGGRIVDLSPAAARKLDMLSAGVVQVRVEIVKR